MGNRHTKSNGNRAKDAPRNGAVINLRAVQKDYKVAAGTFTALKEVDLEIQAGEFVAIVGKSGSGKSTLLNVLAGIDTPTTGEVWMAGTPVHALTQDQLAAWRGKNVGVVFQFFQLLPTLTVVENVMLPMDFGNTTPANGRKQRALALIRLALPRMPISSQPFSPAGSSSALPSPELWRMTQPSSWPMSPLETSTRTRRMECWSSSRAWRLPAKRWSWQRTSVMPLNGSREP
jgi:ABC-type sugar transport system ATPase subunit